MFRLLLQSTEHELRAYELRHVVVDRVTVQLNSDLTHRMSAVNIRQVSQ